jgi:hypothetical protein
VFNNRCCFLQQSRINQIRTRCFCRIYHFSNITPVFKNNKQNDVNNYRPISLLSVISKCMERCVYKHIHNHLLDNDILTTCQSCNKLGILLLESSISDCFEKYILNKFALSISSNIKLSLWRIGGILISDPFTPIIKHPLCKLFNLSLRVASYPSQWKRANITPVFKNNKQNDVNNYRPISLLSVISKCMERCVYKHIHNHLLDNDILSTCQSRFTKGDSAVNQLINITNDRLNSQTKTIRNFRQYTQVVSKLSLWEGTKDSY